MVRSSKREVVVESDERGLESSEREQRRQRVRNRQVGTEGRGRSSKAGVRYVRDGRGRESKK